MLKFAKIIRGKNFLTAAKCHDTLPMCELQLLPTYMRCAARTYNVIIYVNIFVNGGLITEFMKIYRENLELYGMCYDFACLNAV